MEICILIFVLFWIMFGHVLCSCCTMSMQEGMQMIQEGLVATAPVAKKRVYDNNHTTDSTSSDTTSSDTTTTEGFVSSNNKAYGPEFGASKAPGYIMRPDSWAMPTLSYSKGTTPSAGAQAIMNRPQQPIPLREGELDMFATTQFKPECCPNSFSSSEGCACMTNQQLKYLHGRGGNNVPYSEY
jgi:hypothetical protein